MIANFPKPPGFASITSPRPSSDSIPLGRVLRSLADRFSIEDPAAEATAVLDEFISEHERFADSARINRLSCPHAVKSWAAERLPMLGISYGFSNQVTSDAIQSNLDERAPLKLVEFADDLALIAGFCRNIEELKIEARIHSHGLEFRFAFQGTPRSASRQDIEEECFRKLLNESARENSLKRGIIANDAEIEAEVIVLRKKVRLGFSPVM